jgi:hypothetical protein
LGLPTAVGDDFETGLHQLLVNEPSVVVGLNGHETSG